jgi:hypothetical protein
MRLSARRTCWAVGSALAASAFFASSATAQVGMPRAAVMSGARVRVSYPGIRRRVGTLVALNRDTLVTRWESGATSRMAFSRVTNLEISTGRFPHPREAAQLGAAIGLAGGLFLMATGVNPLIVVVGPAYGIMAGTVVGTVHRTDRWHPVLGGGEVWRVGIVTPRGGIEPHIVLSRRL